MRTTSSGTDTEFMIESGKVLGVECRQCRIYVATTLGWGHIFLNMGKPQSKPIVREIKIQVAQRGGKKKKRAGISIKVIKKKDRYYYREKQQYWYAWAKYTLLIIPKVRHDKTQDKN